MQEGKTWVVDMDIANFLDHVNHDILMNRIGKTIRDKRVLRLIGKYLRAGVMMDGVVHDTEEGTPQGGPLSPLLANIYLDALDQELERRGLAFSRYADDGNIYCGSERAAERVMVSIVEWIREHLRLEANAKKSGVEQPEASGDWLRDAIRSCGYHVGCRCVQSPALTRSAHPVVWEGAEAQSPAPDPIVLCGGSVTMCPSFGAV